MKNIGIVGAGVAGLQLGLFLRQHNIDVTIYAERSASEQLGTQLPSLVARQHHTRERERALGVSHWDMAATGPVKAVNFGINGEQPLDFTGHFDHSSIIVDMRIYTARLLEDFAARGGKVIVGALDVAQVDQLSAQHDLMVVSTGRGGLGPMFERLAEHSPFAAPQRQILTGIFRGVRQPTLTGDFKIIPECGEIFVLPIYSFEPGLTGIGVEAIFGGPLESMARLRAEDGIEKISKAMLEVLQTYAPEIAARIDVEQFTLTRPLDMLSGALTPTVRRAYATLPSGRLALALGDTHVLNDPILGQGANNASYTAWLLGEAIVANDAFDLAFCNMFEERAWEYIGPVTAFNNAMLQPPADHVVEFLVAASQNQELADTFVNFLAQPVVGWNTFSDPAKVSALLEEHGWQGIAVAAD